MTKKDKIYFLKTKGCWAVVENCLQTGDPDHTPLKSETEIRVVRDELKQFYESKVCKELWSSDDRERILEKIYLLNWVLDEI